MKWLSFSLVLALANTAGAAAVIAPKDWVADAEKAVSLTKALDGVAQFGGARSVATTEVYRSTDRRANLYVTRAAANVTDADRDRAASAHLRDLGLAKRHGTVLAATAAHATDQRLLEERVTATADGVRYLGRVVIAADAQHVVAVQGECYLAADVPEVDAKLCEVALETLDPDIPVAARVPLAIVDVPAQAAGGGSGSGSSTGTSPSMNPATPPLLDDGTRPVLPPRIVPAERTTGETDRRPILVGAGLVVLAAIFWWNRKRREQFERAEAGGSRREARDTDADADDLHAAAEAEERGAEPKDKG